jgi:tellurium resistance protein TerZ
MFPVRQYGPVVRLYCRTLSITVQQPHKQQQLGLAFGRRTNWEKKQGDDDTILFQLDRVPHDIVAMYIILTASTPEMRFSDIKSTLRVIDIQTQHTICNFTPARHPNATAMFLVLLAREDGQSWVLSPIEDTHPTARNFGSLMPYIKSYTRDLIPTIQIDPTERVAILRKGGNVRLDEYCKSIPALLTFGLAWDVTDGVNIDLDASVVCLDANLDLVDTVWFRKLQSDDGSIQHCGDEREGDEIGDDEKINLRLMQVPPNIQYLCFVINSYSGQELDDVDRAFCHLYDPLTNMDIASYALTNSSELDKHSALLVSCLYRGPNVGEWCLCIISKASQGRTVNNNVGDLQNYLRMHRPKVPPPMGEEEQEIDLSQMPEHVPLQDVEIDLSLPPR